MFVPDPYEKLKRMRKRLYWEFPDLFGKEFDFFTAGARTPPADLRKERNELVLSVEMPGLSKEDIRVDLHDDTLQFERATTA